MKEIRVKVEGTCRKGKWMDKVYCEELWVFTDDINKGEVIQTYRHQESRTASMESS